MQLQRSRYAKRLAKLERMAIGKAEHDMLSETMREMLDNPKIRADLMDELEMIFDARRYTPWLVRRFGRL